MMGIRYQEFDCISYNLGSLLLRSAGSPIPILMFGAVAVFRVCTYWRCLLPGNRTEVDSLLGPGFTFPGQGPQRCEPFGRVINFNLEMLFCLRDALIRL
jgi:hypothetical protein